MIIFLYSFIASWSYVGRHYWCILHVASLATCMASSYLHHSHLVLHYDCVLDLISRVEISGLFFSYVWLLHACLLRTKEMEPLAARMHIGYWHFLLYVFFIYIYMSSAPKLLIAISILWYMSSAPKLLIVISILLQYYLYSNHHGLFWFLPMSCNVHMIIIWKIKIIFCQIFLLYFFKFFIKFCSQFF